MTNSGVSVIIPVWNGESTIRRAITSALRQTFSPLEILVCDDGSTDKTKTVVKAIRSPSVRWIPAEKHSGLPAVPRNKGIAQSKGEWLAFLDADDSWMRRKLERQLLAMKRDRTLASCTNATRTVRGIRKGKLISWDRNKLFFHNLLFVNRVVCSSVVFHRSLLTKVLGFPEARTLKGLRIMLYGYDSRLYRRFLL